MQSQEQLEGEGSDWEDEPSKVQDSASSSHSEWSAEEEEEEEEEDYESQEDNSYSSGSRSGSFTSTPSESRSDSDNESEVLLATAAELETTPILLVIPHELWHNSRFIPESTSHCFDIFMAIYSHCDGSNWLRQRGWQDAAYGEPPSNFIDSTSTVSKKFDQFRTWDNIDIKTTTNEFLPSSSGSNNTGNQGQASSISSRIKDRNGRTMVLVPKPKLGIDLSHNQLSNALPDHVDFSILSSSLTRLNLSGNRLMGKLPETFSALKELRELSLGHNKLSGTIPSQFFRNMKELKILSLKMNKFSGECPRLNKLRSLELAGMLFV
jgi:hypothetical protein